MKKSFSVLLAGALLALVSSSSFPQEQKKKKEIKVVSPQKDLEAAIKNSTEGDIFIYGGDGHWHHIDKKEMKEGTRVYVLGTNPQEKELSEE